MTFARFGFQRATGVRLTDARLKDFVFYRVACAARERGISAGEVRDWNIEITQEDQPAPRAVGRAGEM
ncbi:hypothetical protein [Hyphomicrobium sp. 99]|uniref:hypothetical protein n=1 Tax=Hyphomicrobium sp. 99 TaxID=1163419 RepID=UPI0005F76D70|nr:hypothetical protein [Hyphomicrobium sp. 99]